MDILSWLAFQLEAVFIGQSNVEEVTFSPDFVARIKVNGKEIQLKICYVDVEGSTLDDYYFTQEYQEALQKEGDYVLGVTNYGTVLHSYGHENERGEIENEALFQSEQLGSGLQKQNPEIQQLIELLVASFSLPQKKALILDDVALVSLAAAERLKYLERSRNKDAQDDFIRFMWGFKVDYNFQFDLSNGVVSSIEAMLIQLGLDKQTIPPRKLSQEIQLEAEQAKIAYYERLVFLYRNQEIFISDESAEGIDLLQTLLSEMVVLENVPGFGTVSLPAEKGEELVAFIWDQGIYPNFQLSLPNGNQLSFGTFRELVDSQQKEKLFQLPDSSATPEQIYTNQLLFLYRQKPYFMRQKSDGSLVIDRSKLLFKQLTGQMWDHAKAFETGFYESKVKVAEEQERSISDLIRDLEIKDEVKRARALVAPVADGDRSIPSSAARPLKSALRHTKRSEERKEPPSTPPSRKPARRLSVLPGRGEEPATPPHNNPIRDLAVPGKQKKRLGFADGILPGVTPVPDKSVAVAGGGITPRALNFSSFQEGNKKEEEGEKKIEVSEAPDAIQKNDDKKEKRQKGKKKGSRGKSSKGEERDDLLAELFEENEQEAAAEELLQTLKKTSGEERKTCIKTCVDRLIKGEVASSVFEVNKKKPSKESKEILAALNRYFMERIAVVPEGERPQEAFFSVSEAIEWIVYYQAGFAQLEEMVRRVRNDLETACNKKKEQPASYATLLDNVVVDLVSEQFSVALFGTGELPSVLRKDILACLAETAALFQPFTKNALPVSQSSITKYSEYLIAQKKALFQGVSEHIQQYLAADGHKADIGLSDIVKILDKTGGLGLLNNSLEPSGINLLYHAIMGHDYERALLLVQHGANLFLEVEKDGKIETAFHSFLNAITCTNARLGDPEKKLLEAMLDRGAQEQTIDYMLNGLVEASSGGEIEAALHGVTYARGKNYSYDIKAASRQAWVARNYHQFVTCKLIMCALDPEQSISLKGFSAEDVAYIAELKKHFDASRKEKLDYFGLHRLMRRIRQLVLDPNAGSDKLSALLVEHKDLAPIALTTTDYYDGKILLNMAARYMRMPKKKGLFTTMLPYVAEGSNILLKDDGRGQKLISILRNNANYLSNKEYQRMEELLRQRSLMQDWEKCLAITSVELSSKKKTALISLAKKGDWKNFLKEYQALERIADLEDLSEFLQIVVVEAAFKGKGVFVDRLLSTIGALEMCDEDDDLFEGVQVKKTSLLSPATTQAQQKIKDEVARWQKLTDALMDETRGSALSELYGIGAFPYSAAYLDFMLVKALGLDKEVAPSKLTHVVGVYRYPENRDCYYVPLSDPKHKGHFHLLVVSVKQQEKQAYIHHIRGNNKIAEIDVSSVALHFIHEICGEDYTMQCFSTLQSPSAVLLRHTAPLLVHFIEETRYQAQEFFKTKLPESLIKAATPEQEPVLLHGAQTERFLTLAKRENEREKIYQEQLGYLAQLIAQVKELGRLTLYAKGTFDEFKAQAVSHAVYHDDDARIRSIAQLFVDYEDTEYSYRLFEGLLGNIKEEQRSRGELSQEESPEESESTKAVNLFVTLINPVEEYLAGLSDDLAFPTVFHLSDFQNNQEAVVTFIAILDEITPRVPTAAKAEWNALVKKQKGRAEIGSLLSSQPEGFDVILALRLGEVDLLKQKLSQCQSPDMIEYQGRTLLHYAAMSDQASKLVPIIIGETKGIEGVQRLFASRDLWHKLPFEYAKDLAVKKMIISALFNLLLQDTSYADKTISYGPYYAQIDVGKDDAKPLKEAFGLESRVNESIVNITFLQIADAVFLEQWESLKNTISSKFLRPRASTGRLVKRPSQQEVESYRRNTVKLENKGEFNVFTTQEFNELKRRGIANIDQLLLKTGMGRRFFRSKESLLLSYEGYSTEEKEDVKRLLSEYGISPTMPGVQHNQNGWIIPGKLLVEKLYEKVHDKTKASKEIEDKTTLPQRVVVDEFLFRVKLFQPKIYVKNLAQEIANAAWQKLTAPQQKKFDRNKELLQRSLVQYIQSQQGFLDIFLYGNGPETREALIDAVARGLVLDGKHREQAGYTPQELDKMIGDKGVYRGNRFNVYFAKYSKQKKEFTNFFSLASQKKTVEEETLRDRVLVSMYEGAWLSRKAVAQERSDLQQAQIQPLGVWERYVGKEIGETEIYQFFAFCATNIIQGPLKNQLKVTPRNEEIITEIKAILDALLEAEIRQCYRAGGSSDMLIEGVAAVKWMLFCREYINADGSLSVGAKEAFDELQHDKAIRVLKQDNSQAQIDFVKGQYDLAMVKGNAAEAAEYSAKLELLEKKKNLAEAMMALAKQFKPSHTFTGEEVQRLRAATTRMLASASKAVLGDVAAATHKDLHNQFSEALKGALYERTAQQGMRAKGLLSSHYQLESFEAKIIMEERLYSRLKPVCQLVRQSKEPILFFEGKGGQFVVPFDVMPVSALDHRIVDGALAFQERVGAIRDFIRKSHSKKTVKLLILGHQAGHWGDNMVLSFGGEECRLQRIDYIDSVRRAGAVDVIPEALRAFVDYLNHIPFVIGREGQPITARDIQDHSCKQQVDGSLCGYVGIESLYDIAEGHELGFQPINKSNVMEMAFFAANIRMEYGHFAYFGAVARSREAFKTNAMREEHTQNLQRLEELVPKAWREQAETQPALGKNKAHLLAMDGEVSRFSAVKSTDYMRRDRQGNTAPHLAVAYGQVDFFLLLKRQHPMFTVKNVFGQTSLHLLVGPGYRFLTTEGREIEQERGGDFKLVESASENSWLEEDHFGFSPLLYLLRQEAHSGKTSVLLKPLAEKHEINLEKYRMALPLKEAVLSVQYGLELSPPSGVRQLFEYLNQHYKSEESCRILRENIAVSLQVEIVRLMDGHESLFSLLAVQRTEDFNPLLAQLLVHILLDHCPGHELKTELATFDPDQFPSLSKLLEIEKTWFKNKYQNLNKVLLGLQPEQWVETLVGHDVSRQLLKHYAALEGKRLEDNAFVLGEISKTTALHLWSLHHDLPSQIEAYIGSDKQDIWEQDILDYYCRADKYNTRLRTVKISDQRKEALAYQAIASGAIGNARLLSERITLVSSSAAQALAATPFEKGKEVLGFLLGGGHATISDVISEMARADRFDLLQLVANTDHKESLVENAAVLEAVLALDSLLENRQPMLRDILGCYPPETLATLLQQKIVDSKTLSQSLLALLAEYDEAMRDIWRFDYFRGKELVFRLCQDEELLQKLSDNSENEALDDAVEVVQEKIKSVALSRYDAAPIYAMAETRSLLYEWMLEGKLGVEKVKQLRSAGMVGGVDSLGRSFLEICCQNDRFAPLILSSDMPKKADEYCGLLEKANKCHATAVVAVLEKYGKLSEIVINRLDPAKNIAIALAEDPLGQQLLQYSAHLYHGKASGKEDVADVSIETLGWAFLPGELSQPNKEKDRRAIAYQWMMAFSFTPEQLAVLFQQGLIGVGQADTLDRTLRHAYATGDRYIEQTKQLVKKANDIKEWVVPDNEKCDPPLVMAAASGSIETVTYLSKKASPEQLAQAEEQYQLCAMVVLGPASEKKKIDILQQLFDKNLPRDVRYTIGAYKVEQATLADIAQEKNLSELHKFLTKRKKLERTDSDSSPSTVSTTVSASASSVDSWQKRVDREKGDALMERLASEKWGQPIDYSWLAISYLDKADGELRLFLNFQRVARPKEVADGGEDCMPSFRHCIIKDEVLYLANAKLPESEYKFVRDYYLAEEPLDKLQKLEQSEFPEFIEEFKGKSQLYDVYKIEKRQIEADDSLEGWQEELQAMTPFSGEQMRREDSIQLIRQELIERFGVTVTLDSERSKGLYDVFVCIPGEQKISMEKIDRVVKKAYQASSQGKG